MIVLIALANAILDIAIRCKENRIENQREEQQKNNNPKKQADYVAEKEVDIKPTKETIQPKLKIQPKEPAQQKKAMETPRKYSKNKLKEFAIYMQLPTLDTCIELKANNIVIPFVKDIAGRRKQVEVSLYKNYEYDENSVILNSLNIHYYKCNTQLTTYQVAGVETDYIKNSVVVNANTDNEIIKFIKSKYPSCKVFINDKIVSFINGEQKIVITHYKHKAEALAKVTLQLFKS